MLGCPVQSPPTPLLGRRFRPPPQVDVRWVAAQLRGIMEGVGSGLAVPLTLKMKAGERWGSMSAME